MVNPVSRQQHYMRNGLLINGTLTVREWGNRLMELNKYFPYFPVDETSGRHGKIYIPNQLQRRAIAWYHEYLAHPGQTQLQATIRQIYMWPNLRTQTLHANEHCRTCNK
jgi:hypothetical protein